MMMQAMFWCQRCGRRSGWPPLMRGKLSLLHLDLGFQILQQRNRKQLKPIPSGRCILPLLFLMAGLSMNNITKISFSWFNFLCFVSNLKLPMIKLMTSREVSRSGSRSMNGMSFSLCQMPSDKSQNLLPTYAQPCCVLPAHSSCFATYCSDHQSYGPSLGLLGISDGTPLW
jgi:hypothetical protein